MGVQKYKTCDNCHKEMKATRDNFKRVKDENGKDVLNNTCRICDEIIKKESN